MNLNRLLIIFFILMGQYASAQDPCDPPIVASFVSSGPVCSGELVTLTFTLPDGDVFDVTYSINGNIFNLTGVANGVTALHVVTVSTTAVLLQVVNDDDDDDSCFTDFNFSIPITVSNPIVSISNQNNPSCGQNNGSITASATGGTAPYQFSLNGGTFQNSSSFGGLSAGNYTVVARDAAGCTADISTDLNSAGGPTVNISSQNNPSCGQNNGSITASATGGTAPYQFSLNGGTFQNSSSFGGLSAGNYTVVARDAAGCTADISTDLNSAGGPTVNISNQNNPTCGQNNGSITASASGGTAPYQFSLNGGTFQNSPSFGGLAAGNYTVVARDAAGCTADILTDLNSAGGPTVSISSQNNPACGQNNGSITASASGGTTPYQFSLNGGTFQNSPSFGGLSAGNYTVVARDAAGCTADISTDLNSAGGPTVSISSQNDPACGQNNGSITASASGGTTPYQFSLNGGTFQNSSSFGGLAAGNYTVVARDAAGCTADISTDLNSAGGPTVSISSQNNPACGQNNGSITASASGGTAPYQFSLNGGTFQNSSSFGGLAAGNYTVRTRDALGCESSNFATTLTNPSDNLPQAAILFSENQGCTSTTFVLTGNLPNGITGIWDSDEVTPSTPNDPIWNVSNVPVGTTLITWTLSAPGCPNYDVAEIILSILPPPTANFDGIINVLTDQQPQVSVLDNDVAYAPVSLQILKNTQKGIASLDNDNNINYQPFSTADGLDTLLYEICYTNCTDVCDTALVVFRNIRSEDPCFFLGDTSNVFTNGLTPNGDYKNDVLVFRLVSKDECQLNFAKSEIIIYNRWGDVVFEAKPYENNWGGKRRKRNGEDGDLLPQGVYYFVLLIKLDDKEYTQFGSVILIY